MTLALPTYTLAAAMEALQEIFRVHLPDVIHAPDFYPDQPPPDRVSSVIRLATGKADIIGAGISDSVKTVEVNIMAYRGNLADTVNTMIDYSEYVPLLLAENQKLIGTVDSVQRLTHSGLVPMKYGNLDMLGFRFSADLHMKQGGPPSVRNIGINAPPNAICKVRSGIAGLQRLIRENIPAIKTSPDLPPGQISLWPATIAYPGLSRGWFSSKDMSFRINDIILEVHVSDEGGLVLSTPEVYRLSDQIDILLRDNPTLDGGVGTISGEIKSQFGPLDWGPTSQRASIGLRYTIPTKLLQGKFSPLYLGPALWLSAFDTKTLYQDNLFTDPVIANSQSVGGWKDKSGNDHHFTQATLAKKPTYDNFGGLPAVDFDGTDDWVKSADTWGDMLDNGDSFTFFALVKPDTNLDGPPDVDNKGKIFAANNNAISIMARTLGIRLFLHPTNAYNVAISASVPYVYSIEAENVGPSQTATVKAFINGALVTTGTVSRSVVAINDQPMIIGSDNDGAGGRGHFDGKILEKIIYKGNLTGLQKNAVNRHLMDRMA